MIPDNLKSYQLRSCYYTKGIIGQYYNSLTECTSDYDRCQVNWFTISFLQTTDRNDCNTKHMAYHNSVQVYEPRLEPVSNGY